MKEQICILAALVVATGAIIAQPLSCTHPDICAPRVITNCPNKNPIADCPTCCCNSTENVEFYNPDRPEPRCIAPPAVYTVTFYSSWSAVCHPDYYFFDAHWSPPTGASHNTSYQMWDACMDNVSPGVAQVSQIGATILIEREYEAAGDSILDTFKADRIDGVGGTSRDLNIDKDHQWVSVVTMLAPSVDRMAGVANLRLCDGHDWKPYVKVCAELFSTATRSERFHPSMERNTIQWNNCSFGYFEFTFKEYEGSAQEPPENCEFESRMVCPPSDKIPDKCRTCCCRSSDNVHFLHPDESPAPCEASESATYKLTLKSDYNPECHPDYVVPPGLEEGQFPYFTRPIVTTNRARRVMTTCNVAANILRFVENIDHTPAQLINEIINVTHNVPLAHRYALPSPESVLSYRLRRRVMFFSATPSTAYATVVSKLLPSRNTFVGVSGLDLCDGSRWLEKIEVCLELLAAINRTENPEGNSKLQGDQCSFGKLIFELKSTKPLPPPEKRGIVEEPTCTPLNESVFDMDIPLEACCYCEFIIEGRVIRTVPRPDDPKYSHTLVVKVEAVYYDEINHIKQGDVVEIKICSLPDRIRWKHIYRLTGSRECGSNELEISERGIFGDIELGVGPCAPHILSGGCDTPRP